MTSLEEYWYCVSSQDELPIYKGKQESSLSSDRLIECISNYKINKRKKNFDAEKYICELIINNPNCIKDLRVLVGVSDKRLYLDLTYIANKYNEKKNTRFVNESPSNLLKHDTRYFINVLQNHKDKELFAKIVSKYFFNKNIIKILDTFSKLTEDEIKNIFYSLIETKELQQRNAKYRGHGAEQELAKVLHDFSLDFLPKNKHLDPMSSHDPNVNLKTMTITKKKSKFVHSFDLIIKDKIGNIAILIQSLIHSSDPGQYGVNKASETAEIKKLVNEYNKSNNTNILLIACVDGVGFCENVNGTLKNIIENVDDFVQMKTLFKLPLILQRIGLIDNISGISFNNDFFNENQINYFVEKYVDKEEIDLILTRKKDINKYSVAGYATIALK